MMLGRTAQNLYWLSRYIERAENMARLLEVGYKMSLTSRREGGAAEHLVSMMQAAEVDEAFARTGRVADVDTVTHFMVFDEENPSSVKSCLLAGRTNARSVRTAITRDMWETLNEAWLEFSQIKPREVRGARLLGLLQWVRHRSHAFRGALLGTVLRNEGYCFSQFGNFVERADNTARILDVKYFILLPRADLVGGDLDIQQWTLILRAASAHRSYRHVYNDRYRASNIADFLILKSFMPRSLAYCTTMLDQTLDMLAELHGERSTCDETMSRMREMVTGTTMEAVFARGLHEFLTEFIDRNNQFSDRLSKSYNFY